MNYSIILRLLSAILFIMGIAFTLCVGVGIHYNGSGAETQSIIGFAYSVGASLILGAILFFAGHQKDKTFFRKEGLAVIGLGWIAASIVGALPYYLILEGCSISDAIFESTSGLTTTGASVFSDFETFPRSLIFWRSLSQWIGGMGVVVFFVAILGFLGAGGKILYSNEASGMTAELDSGRIQTGVKRIWILYLALSGSCILLYYLGGMSLFDAVNHMFTTLSTGGFSTLSESFGGFESPFLEWVAILFMALGGTSFLWILMLLNKNWFQAKKNSEVRAYFILIIGASAILTFVLLYWHKYESVHDAIRTSMFQVISISTTTGFATRDFEEWHMLSHILLMGLMIVGGCSGSTAGGVKVARILVGIKSVLRIVSKSYSSRVVRPIYMNGRALDHQSREAVVTFLLLVCIVIVFSMPILGVLEPGMSFEGNVSTVLACFFNIGPGFSEVGATDNFGFFHHHTKFFLSILMIMGRLELFAVLALFSPAFWRRFS